MSDEDLLADLRAARDRIDRAIHALQSDEPGEGSGEAGEGSGEAGDDGGPGAEGATSSGAHSDISPCPDCGATFASLGEKLDHARAVHDVDV